MPASPRRPAAKDSRRFKAPATPTRPRLSTDERRAQLLELGIEAFSERPFDEVSIDDVAQKAGISKGLLYHYFPTKRDFYVETVQSVADDLVTSTDTDPTLGTLTRLVTGLRAYLDFAERHGTVYSGLLRGGIGSDPEVTRIIEKTRGIFVDRIVEDLPAATKSSPMVRVALRGWVGFVEATCLEWLEKREIGRDDLMQLWVPMLVELLQKLGMNADVA